MSFSSRDPTILPMATQSKLEWEGFESKRFSFPERKHYDSHDVMKIIQGRDLPFLGRKHYEGFNTTAKDDKCSVKTFPHIHNRDSVSQGGISTVKKIEYIPTQRKYRHHQKLHLISKETLNYVHKSSIRNFDVANATSQSEQHISKQMGEKKPIEYLESMRNGLGLNSLGDKIYKNPDYAPNFFKEGGLIAGSSIKERKAPPDSYNLPKHIKFPLNPDRITWKDKEKMDAIIEEKKAVKELEDWEKTTLKESNPKWRDPDAFDFDAGKKTVVDPKMIKKTGKK